MTAMPQPDWFEDEVEINLSRNSARDDDLMPIRQQARRSIATLTRPQKKQEAWRYTDFSGIFNKRFVSPVESEGATPKAVIKDWIYPAGNSYRIVFVNQRFAPELSLLPLAVPGVTVGAISRLAGAQREIAMRCLEDAQSLSEDVFDTLNRALMEDGLLVHVSKDTRVDRPIEVVYLNSPGSEIALIQPRSAILLEAGARAELIERHIGDRDSEYFFNGMTRIVLQRDARLKHYRLQQESSFARHLSRIAVCQHRASRYQSMNIALGSNWSRADLRIDLAGEQAECELDGLYAVSDGQYNDFHIDVQHCVPLCRSRVDFRGLIAGAGTAVFDGRILVLRDAQKSDARLSSKNLLLTEKARVNAKPQLEIYADDVKCSHGTTVGRIDPEQLFYCRSRGLNRNQATILLSLAFASQVIDSVEDSVLRGHLHRWIDTWMNSHGGEL